MLSRPRLKRCFTANIVEPALLFLLADHTQHIFQGEAYVALAPVLDGRSLSDVLSAGAGRCDLPTLFAALAQMETKGVLTEGAALPDAGSAAFWEALGADTSQVQKGLERWPVSLQGDEGVPLGPLQRALSRAGLRVSDDGALLVRAVSDYLDPAIAEVNRAALAEGRPWALVKPLGSMVWIGPLFHPGQTGCWECLAHRLRLNRQVERYLRRYLRRELDPAAPLHRPRAALASTVEFASHWAASELARALVLDGADGLRGAILTLDLVRREVVRHTVVRRPQCPACGGDDRRVPAVPRPVVLASRPRGAGPERATSPLETYERYKHHVSPITGAVTYLKARTSGGEGPVHNWVAGHYLPMSTDSVRALRLSLATCSGGKGRTESKARTSALCEALERYSGIAWGDEPRVHASRAALGDDAIAFRELALFSDRQYATRGLVPPASERQAVHEPLPDDVEISWSPAWSLTQGRVRYLPTGYCYYGHRDPGLLFAACDSNGVAAGNTLEEAILYGLLELVERDSVALWWYNRLRRPAVDADSFSLPYWHEMKRHYAELRRDLHALDLTADLGIPTFAVVSRRQERAVEDVLVGFGAHLDPRVALLRALEETSQYLPSVSEEAHDGSTAYRLISEETVTWWRSATFASQPWLVPDPAAGTRRLRDFTPLASDDVRTDVEACVGRIEGAGLEVLVVDQTRPDIGLPVARVVAPGLRHFWRRLAPGRLYDVPVKMGWRPKPLAEEELNPISCFV